MDINALLYASNPDRDNLVLHDRLQLPCIPNRILDHLSTGNQYVLFRSHVLLRLREKYPPIFHHPSFRLREFHYTPFAVQEEQVLSIRYW